jgi:hypothetical protein
MRIDPDDTFWVVTDPTPESELVDILFECTLHRLELQFLGGLRTDRDHPTIFTDYNEARAEAALRLRQFALPTKKG